MPTVLKRVKPSKQPEYRNNVKKAEALGNLEYVGEFLIVAHCERFKNLEHFKASITATFIGSEKWLRGYLSRLETKPHNVIVYVDANGDEHIELAKAKFRQSKSERVRLCK